MHRTHAVSAGLGALALATTLVLGGCGRTDDASMGGMHHSTSPASTSSPSTSSSVSASFNDADVVFVQGMIPHHEQAVAMSDSLLKKTEVAPQVAALAKQIQDAQQPEIDTMKGWLTAWGQGTGGMHHGSDGGMATAAELEELEKADGASGQRRYLEMMTAHHTGAIQMAQTEISDGKNPDAIKMAKDIVTVQQREITVMKDLLRTL